MVVAAILGCGLFHVSSQCAKSRIAAITRTPVEVVNLSVLSVSKQRKVALRKNGMKSVDQAVILKQLGLF